jgi:hypothetical protein
VVAGGTLTSRIAVVAMGEVLAAAPEAMGMEYGMLQGIAFRTGFESKHLGGVMAELHHQAMATVAPGRRPFRLGMLNADAGLLQQMAQPQDRLGIQVGVVNPLAKTDPGFLAGRHPNPKPALADVLHLGAKGAAQGLHLGSPQPMAQRMGVDRLQGALMVAVHGGARLL